jgi:hypothetical protein
MSIENQGGNDNAHNEVGLGIAPEKGDKNGYGGHADDRSKRDEPPLPYNPNKDKTFDKHRQCRDRKVNAQSGSNPLSTLKPEKDRKDVTEQWAQTYEGYP